MLLIPGGYGVAEEDIKYAVEFVHTIYPKLKYVFTVCTGSWIAARAGALDGKKATSNKQGWALLKHLGTQEGDFGGKDVTWVPHARYAFPFAVSHPEFTRFGAVILGGSLTETYGRHRVSPRELMAFLLLLRRNTGRSLLITSKTRWSTRGTEIRLGIRLPRSLA